MKRSIRLSLVLLMLLPLIACAHMKTSEGRYAEALATYNSLMKSYRAQYELADETTQQEFDQKISPLMGEMSKALTTWKKAKDDATKEEAWEDAVWQAKLILFKYGVIKEAKE